MDLYRYFEGHNVIIIIIIISFYLLTERPWSVGQYPGLRNVRPIPGSRKTGGPANKGVVICEHRPFAKSVQRPQFSWNPGKPNRHRRLRIISQIDLGDLRFDLLVRYWTLEIAGPSRSHSNNAGESTASSSSSSILAHIEN